MIKPSEKTCRRWNIGCGRCDLCCDEPIDPGYGGYYGTDPIPPELDAIPYIREDWPPFPTEVDALLYVPYGWPEKEKPESK